MRDEVVVVVAGGEQLRPDVAALLQGGERVLAADRGLEHARALGLEPEAVIGDMDSVSAEALADAELRGLRIVRHPAAKDATDLELALEEAFALAPSRIVVLVEGGGRLDHLLSALLQLGSARYADVEIDAQFGAALVHMVRGTRELDGEEGETVSLFALNGAARGVTTEGLEYALSDETLEPGSSRGVSNVFTGQTARVRVAHGVVLVVRPGAEPSAAGEAS